MILQQIKQVLLCLRLLGKKGFKKTFKILSKITEKIYIYFQKF